MEGVGEKFDGQIYQEHPERMAERQQIESMVKADKVFKEIMEYCKKMLKISHTNLNRHLDRMILSKDAKPSVMLKYYNELLKDTNFRIPAKQQLELDQKLYKKSIEKIKRAHSVELQWVRTRAEREAD